jgi:hypothetical protein
LQLTFAIGLSHCRRSPGSGRKTRHGLEERPPSFEARDQVSSDPDPRTLATSVAMLTRPSSRQPPRRLKIASECDWGPRIEIKSAEYWRFQWHEEILKRWDLSRSEVAISGVLMHAYRTDRGFAEIGLNLIAMRAGCSRSTASKATMRLRSSGLIAIQNEHRRDSDGSLEIYRYRLIYKSRGIS